MAVNRFKVALNAARFPLVSSKGQRAVLVPALDTAPRTPRIFMGADESVDYNLPQILYGENFMPLSEGVHSVGYTQRVAPTVNSDFNQLFPLRDDAEGTVLYSPAAGKNYVYDSVAGAWETTSFATIFGAALDGASPNTPATATVTYAYVDGKTFVCYSRLLKTGGTDASIMVWNPTTQALAPAGALIAVLPFAAGTIDGISSSNGYLIVWSGLSVAWAPFNGTAFDFTIYANGSFTGAGNQIPEDVQGPIRACVAVSGGFVIFTSKNAVAANYHSQNVQAPWVFRGIADAGGVESYEQITVEGSRGSIIAYTTTGMQRITLNSAEEVFPDVSDFIAGRVIERYEFATHALREGSTTLDFFVKLSNIANRYTVVSYGTFPGVYSFALVYDGTLKRWGKLRMVHRDCFYYNFGAETAALTYADLGGTTYSDTTQESNGIVAAQHGLAFLKSSGEVVIADWSDRSRVTRDESCVILGRLQLSRASNIQLNRVDAEGMKDADFFVQPSYDGKTLDTAVAMISILVVDDFKVAGELIDCKNFNLAVEGSFNLTTVIMEASTAGKY
jgi:hypothetical protein